MSDATVDPKPDAAAAMVMFEDYVSRLRDSARSEAAAAAYVERHLRRMQELVGLVWPLAQSTHSLCEVGVGHYSFLWPELLPDVACIFADCNPHAERSSKRHGVPFVFVDLNVTALRSVLPRTVDLLLFTEVLEHLHSPPGVILKDLADCLNPGGRIVLSTPNFLSIGSWKRFLTGWNPAPYPAPGAAAGRDHHVREYTMRELRALVPADLQVERRHYSDCWDHDRRRPARWLCACLPHLRSNLVMVLRKTA